MDIKHTKNKYPTQIELCEGKYTIIYDFETGRSECLRYNEPWRKLAGDKMVLACFDEIVSMRQQRDELLAVLKFALDVAQSHNDNIPFDWALYCEMLHKSISKAEQSHD